LQRGFGRFEILWQRGRFAKLKKSLTTGSWESYALFRAGVAAENQGNYLSAKALYVRAQRLDPALSLARINLAGLARRDRKNWQLAKSLYETAIVERGKFKESRADNDEQSYFSALFSLASLAYDDPDQSDEDACGYAEDLVIAIDAELAKVESFWQALWRREDFIRYLKFLRPAAIAMYGGLLIAINKVQDGKESIAEIENAAIYLPTLQYNLACAYSLLASNEQDKEPEHLKKSLQYLKNGIWLGGVATSKARKDRALKHVRLKCKEEFDQIISNDVKETKPAPSLPLARLESIGMKNARKLAQVGIVRGVDLLLGATTSFQRETLASKIDVGTGSVLEWAQAMDLSRIIGLDFGDASILRRINVSSVADLAQSDPNSLRSDLEGWGKTSGETRIPSLAMIKEWITDAGSLRPRVQL